MQVRSSLLLHSSRLGSGGKRLAQADTARRIGEMLLPISARDLFPGLSQQKGILPQHLVSGKKPADATNRSSPHRMRISGSDRRRALLALDAL